jgi:hypothetical protein
MGAIHTMDSTMQIAMALRYMKKMFMKFTTGSYLLSLVQLSH